MATTPAPFLIVCDGVGGHQGGDVASQLAIKHITEQLRAITSVPNLAHETIVTAIEEAILSANEAIATLNDAAQNRDRNRMGTTVVSALVYGARLYIAHVGDSRAYRVRPHSCRQVTLDDDVAARETRLGVGLYPDMLQVRGSGALVQVLGMAASAHVRPTVEMYPVATESVFLLCSDGLSDRGLIDRLGAAELYPVVAGERDIATAAKRLVDLANTHNGHDNVTVGLLRVVPSPPSSPEPIPVDFAPTARTSEASRPLDGPAKTQQFNRAHQKQTWPLLLTGIAIAAVAAVWGAYYGLRAVRPASVSPSAETEAGETLFPSAAPLELDQPSRQAAPALGDYLQIQPAPDQDTVATMIVTAAPPTLDQPSAVDLPKRRLLTGSIVQVIRRQRTPTSGAWIRLEVCSMAAAVAEGKDHLDLSPAAAAQDAPQQQSLPASQVGDQGWLQESSLPQVSTLLLDVLPTTRGACTG